MKNWVAFGMLGAFLSMGTTVVAGVLAGSADYVADGLVLQLDGLDNTLVDGVRSHQADATTWCDLSGHGNDVTLPSWVTVEDQSLFSTASTTKTGIPEFTALNGLSHTLEDGPYTVEVVIQRGTWTITDNEWATQPIFSTPRGSMGYRGFSDNLYFSLPSSSSWLHMYHMAGLGVTNLHTLGCVYGTSRAKGDIFCDGSQLAMSSEPAWQGSWSGTGTFKFFGNNRADIRVFAIRVYNRVLTLQERAMNAKIDRIRFLGDSQAYVQDGLVLQLDGLENALTNGTQRIHEASPTTWHDLSGQGNDVTIPSWVMVEANGALSVANTSKTGIPEFAALKGLAHGTNDPAFTVELTMQRVQWRFTDNMANLQSVLTTPRGSFGYRSSEGNGFYALAPESKKLERLWNLRPAGVQAADPHTVTLVFGNGVDGNDFIVDGVSRGLLNADSWTTGWDGTGTFKFFSNPRADIRVHSIRVYNRVLTPYELARNAALDSARFMNADAALLVKPIPDQSSDGVHACTPDPEVVNALTGLPLKKDVDYTVAYADNIWNGTATATITGIGAWAGKSTTQTFKVFTTDAFRELGYLEATGTQCIDTEYRPGPTTRIEAEIQFGGGTANRASGRGATPFGCLDGTSCFTMNFGGSANQDNQLYLWFDRTYGCGGAIKTLDIGADRTRWSTVTIDASTGAMTYGSASTTAVKKNAPAVNTLTLFGNHLADGSYQPFGYYLMRISKFKIYDGDTLVRDFVPVYRVLDHEPGLLDRVSGRFFSNAGTGRFSFDTATRVSTGLPTAYCPLDGVSSTAAQQIDTGVVVDGTTSVLAEIVPYKLIKQGRVFSARTGAASAVGADNLFFETYLNASSQWACGCANGPDATATSTGLWTGSGVGGVLGDAVSLLLDSYGNAFSVNGEKKVTLGTARTKTGAAPLQIMGATAGERSWGRVRDVYVWKSGELTHHFLPCTRVADAVPGLYDLVWGTFHASATTEPLLAGRGADQGVPYFTGAYRQTQLEANSYLTTNFTFTLWAKNPDAGEAMDSNSRYGALVSQGALGNSPGFCLYSHYNTTNGTHAMTLQLRNPQNATTSLKIDASSFYADNKWHHIAATCDVDGKSVKLYLDGKVVASETEFVNPANVWWHQFTIGARTADFSMKGSIAEVTFWNRALSEAEVLKTRQRPVLGTEEGLLGVWSLQSGDAGRTDRIGVRTLSERGEICYVPDAVNWFVPGVTISIR